MSLSDIVMTPCFILDKEKLENNLSKMKAKAKALKVTLRPHLKTHKSLEIAKMQMISPEGPATVSTLKEAAYFAKVGVKDLIYAVGIAPQKLPVVKAIIESGCDLKIICDNVESARAVSDFCAKEKVQIGVLIEVDCDGHRSGLKPTNPEIIKVAEALQEGATLKGVLTHAGDSYQSKSLEAIEKAAQGEVDGIVRAANLLRDHGFNVEIVSVGSTPTATFGQNCEGVTELRAGVYAFCDLFQMNLGVCKVEDIAGSVLTTVIGHQKEKGWVITDSGFLSLSKDRATASQSHDYGFGLVCDECGKPINEGNVIVSGVNQEHGILISTSDQGLILEDFPIGRRLRILPNHACPTVGAYDEIYLWDAKRNEYVKIPRIQGW